MTKGESPKEYVIALILLWLIECHDDDIANIIFENGLI